MGKKQNRKVIYGKKKTYAKSITKSLLNYEVFSTSSLRACSKSFPCGKISKKAEERR